MAPLRNNDDALMLQKLDEVARKQDALPGMLSELERRQNQAIETLRRDFERMFVSRSEYDPKHQIVLDRMVEYDKLISNSQVRIEKIATLISKVEDMDEEIEHIKSRATGLPGRIIPWLSLLIAAAAVLLSYSQHIIIR